jgi:hypothetical protein
MDILSVCVISMIMSRRMRWAGHVALMGEKRIACRILVGKPEGKRPLGRPGQVVDNIKIDLGEIGWVGLAQDRDKWRAPSVSIKGWETIEWPLEWCSAPQSFNVCCMHTWLVLDLIACSATRFQM